jgi:hypothetical protein
LDQVAKYKRRLDGNYVLPLSGIVDRPEDQVEIVEASNPREVNPRWKWLIADISTSVPEEQRTVLVREHDGSLRTATGRERRMHMSLYPTDVSKAQTQKAVQELWEI